MPKREFVQLAKVYKAEPIMGYFASEKLDGMRAIWDGGITRGLPTKEVPFANTTKDGRYQDEQIATGLWTRYGKAIQAPDWWLDQLPKIQLDGELWMGRGKFQQVISAVKQLNADERWELVKFPAFNIPAIDNWLAAGEINNPTAKFDIEHNASRWAKERSDQLDIRYLSKPQNFLNVRKILNQYSTQQKVFKIHKQVHLNGCMEHNFKVLDEMKRKVLDSGGEGLILSYGQGFWKPERNGNLLKIKPSLDAEAEVVGCTFGKETDKGSKLLGLMGALIVEWNGVRFNLSGFTDEEREVTDPEYATNHPGEVAPEGIYAKHFPIGSHVTFQYRETTDEGKPKDARYHRKYEH